ncbi:MAG: hypothetical protein KGL90_03465 [Burkholderiales bacterium]|nr:hypothetical protein [Burkholderiales bacterium]
MHEDASDLRKQQLLEMQSALLTLRDGLMNLSLSLRDLSSMTDEHGQRQASVEVQQLMTRLREL